MSRLLPCLLLLLVPFLGVPPSPGWAATDPPKGENAEIRAILSEEIVPGLLGKSPDLFLRSYLPEAEVYSFTKGKVGVPRYREILVEYFTDLEVLGVEHEVLSVEQEGEKARMSAEFRERVKPRDGTEKTHRYRRYYLLERRNGAWKILADGYNESFQEVKGFHH